MTLKDEFPRSVGIQYATGEEWRNSYKQNKKGDPKEKHHPWDFPGKSTGVGCHCVYQRM